MGKKKIEIKKIEDETKRKVTFTKRRQGLFKKAADICIECDAKIAVIAFSGVGNVFSFGHPSADSVIDRYVNEVEEEEKEMRIEYDHKRRKVSDGGFWWDNIDINKLDSYEKLSYVHNAVIGLKQNVRKRIEHLTSSSWFIAAEPITSVPPPTVAAAASSAIAATSYEIHVDSSPTTAIKLEEDHLQF